MANVMAVQSFLARKVLSPTFIRQLSGVAFGSNRTMEQCRMEHAYPIFHQRRRFSLDASHAIPQAFLWVHQHTGLPWWCVIALGAVTVRCIGVFPFLPAVQRTSARRELCATSLELDKNDIKRRVAIQSMNEDWSTEKSQAELVKQMSQRAGNLYRKEKCQMWRLLLPIPAQLGFWITASMGLRDIIYQPTASIQHALLVDEGTLWFPNLTQPDGGLAMLLCLTMLANIQLSPFGHHLAQQGQLINKAEPTGLAKHLLTGLRCAAVGGFLVAQLLPSGLVLYWSVSSLTALATQTAMKHSRVRRLLRIPPTPSESSDLASDFRVYFTNLMKTFRDNQINYAREQRAKQAAKRAAREAKRTKENEKPTAESSAI